MLVHQNGAIARIRITPGAKDIIMTRVVADVVHRQPIDSDQFVCDYARVIKGEAG